MPLVRATATDFSGSVGEPMTSLHACPQSPVSLSGPPPALSTSTSLSVRVAPAGTFGDLPEIVPAPLLSRTRDPCETRIEFEDVTSASTAQTLFEFFQPLFSTAILPSSETSSASPAGCRQPSAEPAVC